jgi:hypothetical protein
MVRSQGNHERGSHKHKRDIESQRHVRVQRSVIGDRVEFGPFLVPPPPAQLGLPSVPGLRAEYPKLNQEMPSPPSSPFREPSPTSTINSRHGPDETSLSDSEERLTDEQFALKCENNIGLHDPSEAEILANEGPLLYRPPPGSEAEIGTYNLYDLLL